MNTLITSVMIFLIFLPIVGIYTYMDYCNREVEEIDESLEVKRIHIENTLGYMHPVDWTIPADMNKLLEKLD